MHHISQCASWMCFQRDTSPAIDKKKKQQLGQTLIKIRDAQRNQLAARFRGFQLDWAVSLSEIQESEPFGISKKKKLQHIY